MNSMPSSQAVAQDSARTSVVSRELQTSYTGPTGERVFSSHQPSHQLGPRRAGYGLPCAKCKTYYAADLAACPVCQAAQRVPATPTGAPPLRAPESAAPSLDDAALEEERERFLRDFRTQVYESDNETDATSDFACGLKENHEEGFEPAAVCQACYTRLQERVDVLEAAMHMDLREVTQLVYDAVWSDPSDPSQTYQNAAQAVLTELHRRAGISPVLGRLQPLAH